MTHVEKKKLERLYRDHVDENPILPEDIVWIRNMLYLAPLECREVYDKVHSTA